MSSSSTQEMNPHICRKNQSQFLLVSGSHMCASQRDTNMVSPDKALEFLGKTIIFSEYLTYRYEILCRSDFWRSFLFICLLSFPRFWHFDLYWIVCIFINFVITWQWKKRIHYHTYMYHVHLQTCLQIISTLQKGCPTALGRLDWLDTLY